MNKTLRKICFRIFSVIVMILMLTDIGFPQKGGCLGGSAWAELPANAYEDHFALSARDIGPSRKLLGDVTIMLAFVSTPEHPWTPEKKQEVFDVSDSSVRIMTEAAREYGAELNLKYRTLDYSISCEYNKDRAWYKEILNKFYKVQDMAVIQQRYRRFLNVDSAPMIFLFNSWDQSITYVCSANTPTWNDEMCVIFCDTKMHDNYLTHELFHQYGAIDLYDYNGEGVKAAADRIFSHSCMREVSHTVDELTAFLIGWTDKLSVKTQKFLDETKGLR